MACVESSRRQRMPAAAPRDRMTKVAGGGRCRGGACQPQLSAGYRDLPIDRIIEYPIFRDSAESYFVQLADLIAFFLYQEITPSAYVRRTGGRSYFRRLETILLMHAANNGPRGLTPIQGALRQCRARRSHGKTRMPHLRRHLSRRDPRAALQRNAHIVVPKDSLHQMLENPSMVHELSTPPLKSYCVPPPIIALLSKSKVSTRMCQHETHTKPIQVQSSPGQPAGRYHARAAAAARLIRAAAAAKVFSSCRTPCTSSTSVQIAAPYFLPASIMLLMHSGLASLTTIPGVSRKPPSPAASATSCFTYCSTSSGVPAKSSEPGTLPAMHWYPPR